MPDDTVLCGVRGTPGAVAVEKYQRWLLEPDGSWIKKSDFIQRPLVERYIAPVDALDLSLKRYKNGFYIMAVSCRLIETLEAFWQGWETTERHKDTEGRQVGGKKQESFPAILFTPTTISDV